VSAANRCSHCGAPRIRFFGGSSTKHNPGCKTLEQVTEVVRVLKAVKVQP
jgi:endonuclease IV